MQLREGCNLHRYPSGKHHAYHPWQVLTIDTMGPLSAYNEYHYVLTFVVTYSRFQVAVPTKNHVACTVAMFPHYCFNLAIHSDNAPEFTGEIWEELIKLCGFQISHSTPCWPQWNAECECSHRTLINQLRTRLLGDNTKDWPNLIPTIQWEINSSPKEDGITPFKRLFGCHPLLLPFRSEATNYSPLQEILST